MSGAIDLSRIPMPAIVETLDFETIYRELLDVLAASWPEYDGPPLESDPLAKILESFAYRELYLRQRVNDAIVAVTWAFAAGDDLTALAPNLGIERQPGESDDRLRQRGAAAAAGSSVAGPEAAYRSLALAATPLALDVQPSSPAPGSVSVSALAVERDPMPFGPASLPPGENEELRMAIECGPPPDLWVPGTAGSLAGGSAAIAGTGLSAASLRWVGTAGAKALTLGASATLKSRYGAGGPGASLSLWLHDGTSGVEFDFADADAAFAGGKAKWALNDSDGRAAWLDALEEEDEILALVAAADSWDEALSSQELRMLAAIRAALSPETVRPMGDTVTVRAAAVTSYSVSAALTIGPGADAAVVRDAALAAARRYVSGARVVGGAARTSALIAALHAPGVESVALSSPSADVGPVAGSAPECSAITITVAQ